MARDVSAHLFSTINGVNESPDQWQFDAFGQEEGQAMGAALAGVDTVILGRTLWQEWSDYWPKADANDPFAAFINPVRKYVASTSLSGELPWNSQAIDGDPVQFVKELKEQDGGRITVGGGITTVRNLFLGGAIDTLTLTMHPVVAGTGRRVFDETVDTTRLRLADHTITSAGNAMLTYTLRG